MDEFAYEVNNNGMAMVSRPMSGEVISIHDAVHRLRPAAFWCARIWRQDLHREEIANQAVILAEAGENQVKTVCENEPSGLLAYFCK